MTYYKLDPTVFSAWMGILHRVPKSVLWLFSRNDIFENNLRKAAEQQGINSNRLVFARRENKERHLARHKHADLFLDTLWYNAHATAIDALWTGLPLITCIGNTVQSKVSAALLKAIELSELITTNLMDYVII